MSADMEIVSAEALLQLLLNGEVIGTEQLPFVAVLREGEQLDFKSGRLLTEKEAPAVVRQYTSAFANVSGGVLALGFSDNGSIDPCRRQNFEAQAWVRDCLFQISHLLFPPPRVQRIEAQGGFIVLLAIPKAAGPLVPAIERGGRATYWQRFMDANQEIPSPLLQDLQTGRRARPVFKLLPWTGSEVALNYGPIGETGGHATFHIGFRLENAGLVTAREVEVGTIAWTQPAVASSTGYVWDVPDSIKVYIEPSEPAAVAGRPWVLARSARSDDGGRPIDVRPFAVRRFHADHEFPFVAKPGHVYEANIAAYVLAEGHPPDWFQASFVLAVENGRLVQREQMRISRPIDARPSVSWVETPPSPNQAGLLLARS